MVPLDLRPALFIINGFLHAGELPQTKRGLHDTLKKFEMRSGKFAGYLLPL